MPRLTINICLSDIPKALIRHANNGKAYIDININELREGADERGNDHSVSVAVPKDRRNEFPDRLYIGRGKEWKDEPHVGGTSFKNNKQELVDKDNDLPF